MKNILAILILLFLTSCESNRTDKHLKEDIELITDMEITQEQSKTIVSDTVFSTDIELKIDSTYLTSYGGTYSFGGSDNGAMGVIYVYPNSDSTLLFYLELNRGTPSYNSGAIVGQMNIYSPGEADFTMIDTSAFINCSANFWFTNDSLYIRTNDNAIDCGYGYGVYSDGDFKRIDKNIPEFFTERNGEKSRFDELDWTEWWSY